MNTHKHSAKHTEPRCKRSRRAASMTGRRMSLLSYYIAVSGLILSQYPLLVFTELRRAGRAGDDARRATRWGYLQRKGHQKAELLLAS